jgi:hypothetical protein
LLAVHSLSGKKLNWKQESVVFEEKSRTIFSSPEVVDLQLDQGLSLMMSQHLRQCLTTMNSARPRAPRRVA